jgi:hypothetical protein
LEDINRAIAAKLYYPALAVALTVPEICVALTLEDSVFVTSKHYAAFVDKYTSPPSIGIDGAGCYQLRCGVIHRGNAGGSPFPSGTHVIFTIPETGGQIHGGSMEAGENTAIMFSLAGFCSAMIVAAQKWYAENNADPKVIANMPRLLSWHPNGMFPFIGGAPVVGSAP